MTPLYDEARDTLAGIVAADVPVLAARWARIDEFGRRADTDGIGPAIFALSDLASRARNASHRMYVWICL